MNLGRRQLLRVLLVPGALLAAAVVALIGIEVYELQTPGQLRLLVLASMLAFLLMLLLLWRMERAIVQRAHVHVRERSLVEQQRALDRLHSGVGKMRAQPWQARWMKLAEARRVSDSMIIAGWEQRYQELLAHPTRNTWADEALKGNFPSDAEIDYETDTRLLLTCVHLQPIEAAIRKSNVYCSALSPTSIVTFASLHYARARRHYALPSHVEWETRSDSANVETSALVCRLCDSRIQSGSGEPFPP